MWEGMEKEVGGGGWVRKKEMKLAATVEPIL